jgi:hypothetical protein
MFQAVLIYKLYTIFNPVWVVIAPVVTPFINVAKFFLKVFDFLFDKIFMNLVVFGSLFLLTESILFVAIVILFMLTLSRLEANE